MVNEKELEKLKMRKLSAIEAAALDRAATRRFVLKSNKPQLVDRGPSENVNGLVSVLGNAGRGHHEAPSQTLPAVTLRGPSETVAGYEDWVIDGHYYGVIRRYPNGFWNHPESPWALIGITSVDETARHDWREFQQIKNMLVGPSWEAVEIYPDESRLVDPSNRFYLWCVPAGVLRFGFNEGRSVVDGNAAIAPQRPFPLGAV